MTNIHLLAEIIGILGLICTIIGYAQKEDPHIHKILVIAYMIWVTHFLLLGAYSAMVACIIGGVRVFLSFKYKNSYELFYAIVFSTIIFGMITYDGFTSTLPIIGSIIAAYAFFFTEKLKLRYYMVTFSFIGFVYAALIGSYAGMINEIIVQFMLFRTIYHLQTSHTHPIIRTLHLEHLALRK